MTRVTITALLAGLVACGGRSPEQQTWDQQMANVRTAIQVFTVHQVDGEWLESPDILGKDAALVWERECKKSGTGRLYDDGTLVFDECVVDKETRLHGTIIENEDQFVFQDFQTGFDDPPWTVNGGYTWNGDVLTIDQTFEGTHEETGHSITTAAGTMILDRDAMTVTGSFTISTIDEYSGGQPFETGCAFEEISLGTWVQLLAGKERERVLNRMCPQAWDEEVQVRLHLRHRHDGDEDPIHIALPGETIRDGKKVAQGGKKTATLTMRRGEAFMASVGRGGTPFGVAYCPPATDLEDLEVVYDDGFGLNTFSAYCIFEGQDPPLLLD